MVDRKWIKKIVLSCIISLCLLFIVALYWLIRANSSLSEILFGLSELGGLIISNPLIWFGFVVPWIVFCVIRYLYRGYHQEGMVELGKRGFFGLGIPILLVFLGVNLINSFRYNEVVDFKWDTTIENNNNAATDLFARDSLQRGIHIFGRGSLNEDELKPLLKNNIEWVTLVPYGWQESTSSTTVGRTERNYGKLNRRDSMYMHQIRNLRSYGLKVMLKPHIWMHRNKGGWRSDISFRSREDWDAWKESYKKFILHYARLASLSSCEQFCVGTELHQVAKNHPEYWRELIREIRSFYSGKITYAANWYEEVEDVKFWDELDYIGIQAYYPLSEKEQPSVKTIMKGWKGHLRKIESFHLMYKKPVLFTELGYKSTLDAAKEPWTWVNSVSPVAKISNTTQANCYEAFFRTFWDKPWFSGVHLWQWQAGERRNRGRAEINFTPQDKPAENIMARWFAQTR